MRDLINAVHGAKTFKPPHSVETDLFRIFLAGSIDMGAAIDWQKAVEDALAAEPVALLNPRRDDWDSSLEQDISNDEFRGQVEWELDGLDSADFIVIYFDAAGKAPITLMELGLHAESHADRMVVCCPEGFWRRGNVQVVCDRYNIPLVETLEEMIKITKDQIRSN